MILLFNIQNMHALIQSLMQIPTAFLYNFFLEKSKTFNAS